MKIFRCFINADPSITHLNEILIYICLKVPFPEGLKYLLSRNNTAYKGLNFDDNLLKSLINDIEQELKKPYPRSDSETLHILQNYLKRQGLAILRNKRFVPNNIDKFMDGSCKTKYGRIRKTELKH